jgi:hypothetical protein
MDHAMHNPASLSGFFPFCFVREARSASGFP